MKTIKCPLCGARITTFPGLVDKRPIGTWHMPKPGSNPPLTVGGHCNQSGSAVAIP